VREAIVDAVVTDTGNPPLDALSGDVLVTLEQMLYYEHHAAKILAPRKVGASMLFYHGARFEEQFEPHGAALIYGASNYPFQLAMIPAITALYAGNAVVLKASERTPAVARKIEELFSGVLPPDLAQVASDEPEAAGAYIGADPDIVFFTGSSANGRAVAAQAAARLIPTVLELGGKDAALIFADCNLERTVEGVVYGAFSHAGQVCVAIKRAYVEQSIYDEFLRRLLERVATLRVGHGHDFDLGTLHSESARQRLDIQVEDALARGAHLDTGHAAGACGDAPMVLSHVPDDARLLIEETFGPVLCVAPFFTEAEAIQRSNASEFALSASVWTGDMRRGQRVAAALRAGSCAVNDVIRNIANPHAAFGGNGASGYGRYHGPDGLRAFSRVKTVMAVGSSRGRPIHWFPFTRATYEKLGALIDLRHGARGAFFAVRRLFLSAGVAALAATALTAQTAQEGRLLLSVQLPPNAHGELAYLVFNSPDGFPQDKAKAMRSGFVTPAETGSTVRIDAGNLPPGQYAVTVYQDENGNRNLDAGFLGIPKEPVGASNNPKGRMGPSRFSDCVFSMGPANQTVSIRLVRPR